MYNLIYFSAVVIFTCGLFIMITSGNYVRKIVGLGIFQSSVLIFYIALGKVSNGIVPISHEAQHHVYTSPLPHVLMLTAIVVGFATLSVGLALIYRIYLQHGTIMDYQIEENNSE